MLRSKNPVILGNGSFAFVFTSLCQDLRDLSNKYSGSNDTTKQITVNIDDTIPGNTSIAVKQFKPDPKQKDCYEKEKESYEKEKAIVDAIDRWRKSRPAADSKNLIRLFGSSSDESRLEPRYQLFFECATLGSLHKKMEKDKGNPITREYLEEYIGYIIDILHGLIFLHSFDCFHNDLKPENILIWLDEFGKLIAKLGDFGLAEIKPTVCSNPGSPLYQAPELLFRNRPPNEKSDGYSVAIIGLEMLAQKDPHSEVKSIDQLRKKISNGDYDDIPNNCPSLISKFISEGRLYLWEKRATPTELLAIAEEARQNIPRQSI